MGRIGIKERLNNNNYLEKEREEGPERPYSSSVWARKKQERDPSDRGRPQNPKQKKKKSVFCTISGRFITETREAEFG